jgi:hypothetical protein
VSLSWRVWYGHGGTFSSADGTPWDVPGFGVQVVAQADAEVGRFLLFGDDYFWWEHDRWWSGDLFGVWDYLGRPGPRKVLFGRQLPNDTYAAVVKRASEDPALPEKTGWATRERRPP